MKTSVKTEHIVEIIMLSTNKISYVMLSTVILVSVMIHTSVSAKDFNEKAGDLSVSTAENLIAMQKGVDNAEMLAKKTKEGLAALRNSRKLINDIAKKLGNKRYADNLKGVARQLTKNIIKMDGALKKLGSSKIEKISKQLTRGVDEEKISVAENAEFAKFLAEYKENISHADDDNFGMKAIVFIANKVIPFSGDLTKSTVDNMKGIDRGLNIIRDAQLNMYMVDADSFDLLTKKEWFELRIKNPKYKAKINQASDVNDLEGIYSEVLKEEIEQYEKLVKSIDDSIEAAQKPKLFVGRESHIKSLEPLKQKVKNQLERIKSGDDFEKQLSDIFYLTAGSIIAEKVDQKLKQTHDYINAQADQLAANRERILNIANKANESYNYDEYSPDSLASLENRRNREIKRKERDDKIKNIKQQINEKYKQKIQAERAAKRRQEQERIKQKIRNQYRARQRANAESSGAGSVLSAADSLRLGGNYAYGVAYGKRFISILRPYRNQSAALTKNGGNNSASLFFDNLLEETTSNSPKFSARVKASSAGYGDYNHTAWGAWSGGQNTLINLGNAIDYYIQARNGKNIFINTGKMSGGISGWSSDLTAQGGYWVYGQRPGIADIPRSGSARYVGQLMGGFWADRESSIPETNSITGDIKMAVTFRDSNYSLSGSLNLKRSGADWASASFNTLNAKSAPNEKFRSSDHFSTLLNSTSGGGRLTGSFFGANVAEAGGAFNFSKREGADRGSAIGVFRAKNVGSAVDNVSAADRQKLLSGNYALLHGPITYGGGQVTLWSFLGNSDDLPFGNGSSSSLTLRFPDLKESIPHSDPAKGNTLIPSDRIKVHARDYGDYSHLAWGSWSGGKNTKITIRQDIRTATGGHWSYGQRLSAIDIPKSGSARYTGKVKGHYMPNRGGDTIEMNSITGDINMNVTFRDSNFSLSGAMNLDRNGEDWATARFINTKAKTSYTKFYQFEISGPNYIMNGNFYGPNAVEVGGGFAVMKGVEAAYGVFRAKKQ